MSRPRHIADPTVKCLKLAQPQVEVRHQIGKTSVLGCAGGRDGRRLPSRATC